MIDSMDEHDLEATNLKHGTVLTSEIVYFTGGLAGLPLQGDVLALVPLRGAQKFLRFPICHGNNSIN